MILTAMAEMETRKRRKNDPPHPLPSRKVMLRLNAWVGGDLSWFPIPLVRARTLTRKNTLTHTLTHTRETYPMPMMLLLFLPSTVGDNESPEEFTPVLISSFLVSRFQQEVGDTPSELVLTPTAVTYGKPKHQGRSNQWEDFFGSFRFGARRLPWFFIGLPNIHPFCEDWPLFISSCRGLFYPIASLFLSAWF